MSIEPSSGREAALTEIIELSRWAGDPARDLAMLAEGNASVKCGDSMLVKASGARMQTAEASDFVEVDRGSLERFILSADTGDAAVRAAFAEAQRWGAKQPSVETLLHIVCQSFHGVSVVLHTHPVAVNGLLCSDRGEQFATQPLFPDQIVTLGRAGVYLPYVDPGLPLARIAWQRIREFAERELCVPKVVYLENHGMFALGASSGEAKRITEMAVKSAKIFAIARGAGQVHGMSAAAAERIHTRPDELLRRAALAGE